MSTGRTDVRVRLGATGAQQIIDQLRGIRDEMRRTGRQGRQGFLDMNTALAGLRRLLPAISFATVVAGATRFARSAAASADEAGWLADVTGTTAERLSVLRFQADLSNNSVGELRQGMVSLAQNIRRLEQGSRGQVEAFRAMGLSAKDFLGLDTAQQFALVSERLADMEAGATRTAIAKAALGDAGARLLPTLIAVGEKGLAGATAEAERFNQVVSSETAQAVTRANNSMTLMTAQARGVALQFVAGLAPAVADTFEGIAESATELGPVFRELGRRVGVFVRFWVELFGLLGSVTRAVMVTVREIVFSVYYAVEQVLRGNFRQAARALAESGQAIVNEGVRVIRDAQERIVRLVEGHNREIEDKQRERGPILDPPDAADNQAAQARLTFVRRQIDAELALQQERIRREEQADKAAYQRGLIDLQEFYRRRERAAERAFAAELQALRETRAAIAAMPVTTDAEEISQRNELLRIDDQIRLRTQQRYREAEALANEQYEAERQLGEQRLALEQQVLEAQGRRREAALAGLDLELRRADRLMRQLGQSDEQRAAVLEVLRLQGQAAADFQQHQQAARLAMSSLDRERAEIQSAMDRGVISQLRGQRMLAELERQRLPALREIAEQMRAAAEASADPQLLDQVAEFDFRLREIQQQTRFATLSLQQFATAGIDAAAAGLTEFFTTGIQQAESFEDAFRSMAAGVIAQLQRMAAEALTAQLLGALMPGGAGLGAAAARGFARGGYTGDGPMMKPAGIVHAGEFVARKAVVRQPGARAFLEDFNRRGMLALGDVLRRRALPGYASGGLVAGGAAAQSLSAPMSRLEIGLESGLVLRQLQTAEGQRVIVRTLAANRRAASKAIGGS